MVPIIVIVAGGSLIGHREECGEVLAVDPPQCRREVTQAAARVKPSPNLGGLGTTGEPPPIMVRNPQNHGEVPPALMESVVKLQLLIGRVSNEPSPAQPLY
jgi:hypothetical protein